MKTYILLLLLVTTIKISAQEVTCLDYKLYNSTYDVEQMHQEKTSLDSLKKQGIELQDNMLQIIVVPNTLTSFSKWSSYQKKGINKGFKIFIANTTKQNINLFNIDGIVTFSRQVYHSNEWHTISSFDKKPAVVHCGNSFLSDKIIKSNEIQTFIASCINGENNVKFRFKIKTKPIQYGEDPNQSYTIYSNEFEGSFNETLLQ